MISDAAEQIAKTAKAAEIDDIRATLKLPAVTKGLDALYAISKLLTGFSYEDSRTFSGFSAWASRQDFDSAAGVAGSARKRPDSAFQAQNRESASSRERSDLDLAYRRNGRGRKPLRPARFTPRLPLCPKRTGRSCASRPSNSSSCTMCKRRWCSRRLPSVMAASLSDEQLAVLHGFVRSPAFAKLFDLLRYRGEGGNGIHKRGYSRSPKVL